MAEQEKFAHRLILESLKRQLEILQTKGQNLPAIHAANGVISAMAGVLSRMKMSSHDCLTTTLRLSALSSEFHQLKDYLPPILGTIRILEER